MKMFGELCGNYWFSRIIIEDFLGMEYSENPYDIYFEALKPTVDLSFRPKGFSEFRDSLLNIDKKELALYCITETVNLINTIIEREKQVASFKNDIVRIVGKDVEVQSPFKFEDQQFKFSPELLYERPDGRNTLFLAESSVIVPECNLYGNSYHPQEITELITLNPSSKVFVVCNKDEVNSWLDILLKNPPMTGYIDEVIENDIAVMLCLSSTITRLTKRQILLPRTPPPFGRSITVREGDWSRSIPEKYVFSLIPSDYQIFGEDNEIIRTQWKRSIDEIPEDGQFAGAAFIKSKVKSKFNCLYFQNYKKFRESIIKDSIRFPFFTVQIDGYSKNDYFQHIWEKVKEKDGSICPYWIKKLDVPRHHYCAHLSKEEAFESMYSLINKLNTGSDYKANKQKNLEDFVNGKVREDSHYCSNIAREIDEINEKLSGVNISEDLLKLKGKKLPTGKLIIRNNINLRTLYLTAIGRLDLADKVKKSLYAMSHK